MRRPPEFRAARCLALAVACVLAAGSHAQAQTGARARGGRSGEQVAAVAVLADRTVASAGVTASAGAGGLDAWVRRATACGATLWGVTLGGPGDERATHLVAAAAGLLVAGDAETPDGDLDGWWTLLDDGGSPLWSGRLGGAGDDAVLGAAAIPGGGFLLAGQADGLGAGGLDGWIVRLDGSGAVLWQRSYGGPGHDRLHAVAATDDGGAWAAGETDSHGAGFLDVWLLRLDAAGDVLLERTLGGTGDEMARGLAVTADGGTVVAGFTDSAGAGLFDVLVAHIGAAGGLLWQRTAGGVDDDLALAVSGPGDGPGGGGAEVIVAGQSRSLDPGAAEGWSAGFDAAGQVLWQRRFGGAGSETLQAAAPGGSGWALAGATTSWGQGAEDALVVQVDGDGRVLGACGAAGDAALTIGSPALAPGTAASSSGSPATSAEPTGFAVAADTFVAVEICPATPGEVSPPAAAAPLAFDGPARLVWEGAASNCSEQFHLYRGELQATGGSGQATCLAAGLTAPQADDAAMPAPGGSFFYLVSGTAAGVEGSLGRDSSGSPRVPASSCR